MSLTAGPEGALTFASTWGAVARPVAAADYDLAGPQYDGSPTGPPARRSYVLCSSPRSGSTLLSEALTFAGGAGVPIEYFDPTNAMRVVWNRWGCRSLIDYVDTLHQRRSSPDGVFGLKLHWFQLVAVTEALTTRADTLSSDDLTDAFQRIAPDAMAVRVRRRDQRLQALSWLRAERTGCWSTRVRAAPPPAPAIPASEVEQRLRRLVEQEAAWSALLDRLQIVPHVVFYEDLCTDHAAVVSAAARHVGVTLQDDIPSPRIRRQSS